MLNGCAMCISSVCEKTGQCGGACWSCTSNGTFICLDATKRQSAIVGEAGGEGLRKLSRASSKALIATGESIGRGTAATAQATGNCCTSTGQGIGNCCVATGKGIGNCVVGTGNGIGSCVVGTWRGIIAFPGNVGRAVQGCLRSVATGCAKCNGLEVTPAGGVDPRKLLPGASRLPPPAVAAGRARAAAPEAAGVTTPRSAFTNASAQLVNALTESKRREGELTNRIITLEALTAKQKLELDSLKDQLKSLEEENTALGKGAGYALPYGGADTSA